MNIDRLDELRQALNGKFNYTSDSWIDDMLKPFPKSKSTIQFLNTCVILAQRHSEATASDLERIYRAYAVPSLTEEGLYRWLAESSRHYTHLIRMPFTGSLREWMAQSQMIHFKAVGSALIRAIHEEGRIDNHIDCSEGIDL